MCYFHSPASFNFDMLHGCLADVEGLVLIFHTSRSLVGSSAAC